MTSAASRGHRQPSQSSTTALEGVWMPSRTHEWRNCPHGLAERGAWFRFEFRATDGHFTWTGGIRGTPVAESGFGGEDLAQVPDTNIWVGTAHDTYHGTYPVTIQLLPSGEIEIACGPDGSTICYGAREASPGHKNALQATTHKLSQPVASQDASKDPVLELKELMLGVMTQQEQQLQMLQRVLQNQLDEQKPPSSRPFRGFFGEANPGLERESSFHSRQSLQTLLAEVLQQLSAMTNRGPSLGDLSPSLGSERKDGRGSDSDVLEPKMMDSGGSSQELAGLEDLDLDFKADGTGENGRVSLGDQDEQTPFAQLSYLMKMRMLMDSPKFDLCVGCLILLDSVLMIVSLQYYGLLAGESLGLNQFAAMAWVPQLFTFTDTAFVVIFTAELVLRISIFHHHFFKTFWNIMDLIIVVTGLVDFMSGGLPLDPMILRLMRLGKLSRSVRLVKLARFLHALDLILRSIIATMTTLFWSMLLLFIIQCIFGMVLAQVTQGFLTDETIAAELRIPVYRYCGTFTRTLITMFEITHVSYAPVCRVLMENCGEEFAWIFIFYRCTVVFAVVTVMRSVFIQQTLKVAKEAQETTKHDHVRAKDDYVELKQIWGEIDGEVPAKTFGQFKHMIKRAEMVEWLDNLDIRPEDARDMFMLIADGHRLNFEAFFAGMKKISGAMCSTDIFLMTALAKRIDEKTASMRDTMSPLMPMRSPPMPMRIV